MSSVLDAIATGTGWERYIFGKLVTRSKESGKPDLPPLSVFLREGVVPRSSREDNHNRLGEDMSKYLVVRPNDVVFNKLRTWQGGFGLSHHDGVVSPAYFVCRPRPIVEPRFLHYLLHSLPYLAELTRISKFMPPSQFDILWDDLRMVPIVLPLKPVQRAIADYLDTETARIDALITKKHEQIDRLSERFEASIYDAVTKGLDPSANLRESGLLWAGRIPASWATPTVSANFDLMLGKMLNAEAAAGGDQRPYLRNVNVQWDRFELTDLATMHFSASDRIRCSLRPGDLLVCEGGEVGRAAVWGKQLPGCYFQKAIHRVRPRGKANSRFLMYCLRAAAKIAVFQVEGNTSTIVHLTGEQLRSHRFPWPPSAEQGEIVEHLDRFAAVLERTRFSLAKQTALLGDC